MKKQVFDTKDYLFYLIVAPLFFFLSRQYLQVHEDLGYAFSLVDGSPISCLLYTSYRIFICCHRMYIFEL